jgi:hypothetical protein
MMAILSWFHHIALPDTRFRIEEEKGEKRIYIETRGERNIG